MPASSGAPRPVPAPLAGAAASPPRRPGRSRFAARRGSPARAPLPGRWLLTAAVFADAGGAGPSGDATAAAERRRTLAELLLERYGIVTREHVRAERIAGGFAGLYRAFCELETLGACRRGYFLEGMGGAQFALPGAVERLRAAPAPSAPAFASPRASVLAAADPAQPYGALLPWPAPAGGVRRRPARVAGAYVASVGERPILYLERGGRGLLTLLGAAPPGPREQPVAAALAALAEEVRAGRVGRLALERIDGRPAVGSEWETPLAESGFRAGPRRLTLSA